MGLETYILKVQVVAENIFIKFDFKKIVYLHPFKRRKYFADVAKLVDALDLGSGAERRGGSSPFIRTFLFKQKSFQ